MSRRKVLSLVAALPLAVFGGWVGWQSAASADTGVATASFDCCEDPNCPPGCDVDCPPDCELLAQLDCCFDLACPPGCDSDCPPACDLVLPAETVSKPDTRETCDDVTACCRIACVNK